MILRKLRTLPEKACPNGAKDAGHPLKANLLARTERRAVSYSFDEKTATFAGRGTDQEVSRSRVALENSFTERGGKGGKKLKGP